MKTISRVGLDLVVELEKLALKPYKDQAKLWTIGVGHLLTQYELSKGVVRIGELGVPWKKGITKEQALALLDQDMDWAEKAVNTAVEIELKQNEFDALCSLAFNIGGTAFTKVSAVPRLCNTRQLDRVPDSMRKWKWITVEGVKVVSKGLQNRREKEIKLWKAA